MKRLIIAYVLMGLIISAITFGLIYNYQTKEQMTNLLKQTYQYAQEGDIAAAKKGTEQFISLWNKRETFLILLLHHDKTDEINFTASEFEGYINMNEIPEFCAAILKTISLIEHMWESEKPSFNNIL